MDEIQDYLVWNIATDVADLRDKVLDNLPLFWCEDELDLAEALLKFQTPFPSGKSELLNFAQLT